MKSKQALMDDLIDDRCCITRVVELSLGISVRRAMDLSYFNHECLDRRKYPRTSHYDFCCSLNPPVVASSDLSRTFCASSANRIPLFSRVLKVFSKVQTSSLPSWLSEAKNLRPWSRSRQAGRYTSPGWDPPRFARRGALDMILAREGARWTFSRPCFAPVPGGGASKQHHGSKTIRWVAEHGAQHRNATNRSTNKGAKGTTGLLSCKNRGTPQSPRRFSSRSVPSATWWFLQVALLAPTPSIPQTYVCRVNRFLVPRGDFKSPFSRQHHQFPKRMHTTQSLTNFREYASARLLLPPTSPPLAVFLVAVSLPSEPSSGEDPVNVTE